MMAMLAACVGAGAAIAIPLCLIGHRKRARKARPPGLRLEAVATDTRLVRADAGSESNGTVR